MGREENRQQATSDQKHPGKIRGGSRGNKPCRGGADEQGEGVQNAALKNGHTNRRREQPIQKKESESTGDSKAAGKRWHRETRES